jgi:ribosomal protein S18 acetylase RimI-like enzyme
MGGTGHRNATRYWIDRAEAPRAVLGLSEWGMAMVHDPENVATRAMAATLAGRPLRGICGPAGPTRAVMAAAGLDRAATVLGEDEPHFLLDLSDLTVPGGPGTLGPIDPATARTWRGAYERELHFGTADPDDVARSVDAWIAADSHRMLWTCGRPAALTGFNARLPEIVQIGGVYTPPEARRRGLARRAVALHLAEARAAGVACATLFAASDAAVACYLTLGFRRIGDFALVLFDGEVAP